MTGYVSQIWNPAAFEYGWFPALRSRYYAQARAVWFGDSIPEGVVSGPPIYQTRSQWVLQSLLRTTHPTPGVAGGVGWMPPYYADAIIADNTTRSGGGTFTETNWTWGPKGASLAIPGTGTGTLTFPSSTMSSFRVWYGKSNIVGGQGRARVDGVNQTPTMNGSAASKSDGHFQDFATTRAAHVVDVQCTTASTNFNLVGVQFFDGDESKGIHVIDGSHSGMNASHLLQASMDPFWTGGGMAALEPALVIIGLGTNDWQSFTAAQYLTNIDSLLSKVATAMGSNPYTVALLQAYRPGAAWNSQVWRDMMAGLAARAVGNVCVIPLSPPWPELLPDGSTNAGLMYEATNPVHPNGAGHQFYGEILADALSLPEVRKPPAYIGGTYLPGHSKVRFS